MPSRADKKVRSLTSLEMFVANSAPLLFVGPWLLFSTYTPKSSASSQEMHSSRSRGIRMTVATAGVVRGCVVGGWIS